MNKLRGLAAAAVIAGVTLAAGCASNDTASQAGSGTTGASPTGSPSAAAGPAEAAGPFGPSCPKLPASGPGSAAALASEPVAAAAAQTPALSTLVTAVTSCRARRHARIGAEAITLFAPTNDAFSKIPKATLAKVLADKKALSEILTYHVVGERRAPTELAAGTLPTLQGGSVATKKTGDAYTVNDARVLCGNLQTRNATVYLIDTVLMPKT